MVRFLEKTAASGLKGALRRLRLMTSRWEAAVGPRRSPCREKACDCQRRPYHPCVFQEIEAMGTMKQSSLQQMSVALLPTFNEQHAGNTALLAAGELSDNDLGEVAAGGKVGQYLAGLGGIGIPSFPHISIPRIF
jgi:hypothetical protein